MLVFQLTWRRRTFQASGDAELYFVAIETESGIHSARDIHEAWSSGSCPVCLQFTVNVHAHVLRLHVQQHADDVVFDLFGFLLDLDLVLVVQRPHCGLFQDLQRIRVGVCPDHRVLDVLGRHSCGTRQLMNDHIDPHSGKDH